MSGTIHINEDDIWTSGTVAFLSIVERTWQRLNASEQGTLEEAYSPLRQGFEFIALDELDKEAFGVFFRSCSSAFEAFKENRSTSDLPDELFNGVVECWDEFLNALKKDDRFDDRSFFLA
jgi:hypothetical protein